MIFEKRSVFVRENLLNNIIKIYSEKIHFTDNRFCMIRKLLGLERMIDDCGRQLRIPYTIRFAFGDMVFSGKHQHAASHLRTALDNIPRIISAGTRLFHPLFQLC